MEIQAILNVLTDVFCIMMSFIWPLFLIALVKSLFLGVALLRQSKKVVQARRVALMCLGLNAFEPAITCSVFALIFMSSFFKNSPWMMVFALFCYLVLLSPPFFFQTTHFVAQHAMLRLKKIALARSATIVLTVVALQLPFLDHVKDSSFLQEIAGKSVCVAGFLGLVVLFWSLFLVEACAKTLLEAEPQTL